MPVILRLVLQSVWPACLPFGPPQGLAGHPYALSCHPPTLAPQSCRVLLPFASWGLWLNVWMPASVASSFKQSLYFPLDKSSTIWCVLFTQDYFFSLLKLTTETFLCLRWLWKPSLFHLSAAPHLWGAVPSPCLHGSCYQCQGMSLCLMTEPLSGWRRLSG